MNYFDNLRATQVLFLSIIQSAYFIKDTYGDRLIEPVQGIYTPNSLDPVITPNGHFYTRDEYQRLQEIKDIDEVTTDVINIDGVTVIPAYMMQNKERYLFPTPTIPATEIQLIKCLISRKIGQINPWVKRGMDDRRVLQFIKPGHEDIFINDQLDQSLGVLYDQVTHFIGQDEWYIYFVKLRGVDLVIEKTIDYRVWDWTIRTESGQWTEHNRPC